MHSGRVTAEGSLTFSYRFESARQHGFYRVANGWHLSSIGLGCHAGVADEVTEPGMLEAVAEAFRGGINLFDGCGSPHHPRGEKVIGAALRTLICHGEAKREEFIVCGRATRPAFETAATSGARAHGAGAAARSPQPVDLFEQVARGRDAFGFDTLDIFFLNELETQLAEAPRDTFLRPVHEAFETMELCVERGWVQAYGVASWDGFRRRDPPGSGLQLAELAGVARQCAGSRHHFRFIQTPFNLAMTEALTLANQRMNGEAPRSILDIAADMEIHVITGAPLLQSRLARSLPGSVPPLFGAPETDAQRALQFARSAPCVASTVAGMRRPEHVAENLRLARFAPMSADTYRRLF